MIDREKMIKMLAMTQSSNDSEALIAIRKVNAMLKVNSLDWGKFLSTVNKSPTPYGRTANPQPPKRKPSGPMGRGARDTHPGFPTNEQRRGK